MARIVLGIGTSHGPLLSLEAERWSERAADDLKNPRLNLSDGSWVSYQELAAATKEKYADIATVEHFIRKQNAAQAALDRIAGDLAAADPDIVVIVGDDQGELFTTVNLPAISIYRGDEVVMKKWPITPTTPDYRKTVVKGYAMDDVHRFPAAPAFATELIERLIEQSVDIGSADRVEDPLKAGFGHAYGFPIRRLFRGKPIPVVPVMLNTYYPPNVPTPARCYDVGLALRRAIEASKADFRVAIIASGGLSHFVVDEELDRKVLDAMCTGTGEVLRALPTGALNAGSSEIRNWIMVAGAIAGMTNRWTEYQPLYRTPAGSGIGVAFGVWS